MKNFFSLFLLLVATGVGTFGQGRSIGPRVDLPVYFDVSPPLKDMIIHWQGKTDRSWKDGVVPNYFPPKEQNRDKENVPDNRDQALQLLFGPLMTDTTISNFNGVSATNSVPPDTYGEAGPDCYFQVVNTSFEIFNKAGGKILGPIPSSSIWDGMPYNTNSGDAVVHWDENAQRWLFTQFSLPNYPNGPFYQMIAISQTPDPTGSWYRYQYQFADMPDYPKFGVWPDGYYMSANRFNSNGWQGNGAYAYDRTAMLAGNPDAQRISFEISIGYVTLYPSDCDGTFPPYGTPSYFAYIKNNGGQSLGIYEFHADFATPANSTLGNIILLPVVPFNTLQSGIPQKGTSTQLETLGDRLMYRLQYRVFNGYSAMVVNHSVNASSNRAGVRWYELRKSTGPWGIYQQSTYAPSDNNSRWMGSIAMDTSGTIALGYSVSGSDLYPSIRYTGRYKNDPLNQMTIAERTIINGGGSQTGSWSGRSRWGDYSGMSVDPSCPTTFWYTTEYYPVTSGSSWATRIGSFTFDNIFSTSASASPGIMCLGDSSQLQAIAYGGSGNYTYSWSSVPPGFSSNIPNPKVSPPDTTMYIVAISDGTQTRIDTAVLKIIPNAVADAGEDTTLCAWAPMVHVSGVVSNARDFRWGTLGDGHFTHPHLLSTNYVPGTEDIATGSADILLMAWAKSPCSGIVTDTKHLVIDPCTAVSETVKDEIQVGVAPNPATDIANIELTGIHGNVLLTLSSMTGTPMASLNLELSGQKTVKTFDLRGYAKGVYYITVRTSGKTITEKLVIR
jgi:hypothetical protein